MEVIDEDEHEDTQHSILVTNSEVNLEPKQEAPEPKSVTVKPASNTLAVEKPQQLPRKSTAPTPQKPLAVPKPELQRKMSNVDAMKV